MGSVYKITDGELVYYGSTRQPLHRRLAIHKCPSSGCETKQMNRDNLTIELVEEIGDEQQLLWRERYYIENNECVNKRIAIQTKEERKEHNNTKTKIYYKLNKELINKKKKEYEQKNKELINERKRKPYHCECGSVIHTSDKARHFKSKKHILYCDTI